MKTFAIYGTIVDGENERETMEDLCPAQFRNFISKLEDGDELTL